MKYLKSDVHYFLWIVECQIADCYIIFYDFKLLLKVELKISGNVVVSTYRMAELESAKLSVVVCKSCSNIVMSL